jgi:nucleoprotein TPR
VLEKVLREGLADSEDKLKEMSSASKLLHTRLTEQTKKVSEAHGAAQLEQARLEGELKVAKAQVTAKEGDVMPTAAATSLAVLAPAAFATPAAGDVDSARISEIVGEKIALETELRQQKLDNKRLNNYLNAILVELEQKAPLINEQREAYEKAVRSHARCYQIASLWFRHCLWHVYRTESAGGPAAWACQMACRSYR